MKKIIQRIIAALGISFLFSMSALLYLTFLTAWFNGNQVLVTINDYNEAKFEFILFPIILIFGAYGLFISFNKIFPKRVSNATQ